MGAQRNSLVKSPLFIIILLCLISSVGRFVIDSYLPSLPAIADNFNLASNVVELTLTLYLLGFGLSQLIYGPLSDYYGRRKILLIGMVIFLIGAIGCMTAQSSNVLLASRFVAGLGAGACGVLNRAIARDCFKGAEFSKAWSYTTTTLVITLMLAPLIGGYIQELVSWRANFLLSVVFVGLVLFIIFFTLPETKKQTLKNASTITSNSTSKNNNLKKHLSIKLILLDYKKILFTQSFLISTLFYTLCFSGLIAYFQVSPILFMDHYHLSSSAYGFTSVAIAVSYLLGGQLVSRYVTKLGVKSMLYIGIVILSMGGVSMLISNYFLSDSWVAVLISAVIYVLGTRIVIPNAMSLAMSSVDGASGSTSALIGSIQILGAMLVSAMLSQFEVTSAITLGWFLVSIGVMSFGLISYERQYFSQVIRSLGFAPFIRKSIDNF